MPGARTRVRSAQEEMQAKLEDRRRKIEGLPPVLSCAEDEAPAEVNEVQEWQGDGGGPAGKQKTDAPAPAVAGEFASSLRYCRSVGLIPADFVLLCAVCPCVVRTSHCH